MQYLAAFCRRPAAASGVIYGRFVRKLVPDKYVKFRNLRFNRSREIPPEAIGGGIFDSFFSQ